MYQVEYQVPYLAAYLQFPEKEIGLYYKVGKTKPLLIIQLYPFDEAIKIQRTEMATFSDIKIEEYREAFSLFDTVGDGKIECSESGDVIRSLDFNPNSDEIKKVIINVDPRGIKRITFEEFLPILHAVSQKCPKKPKPEEFFEGLKVFDKDGYGVVLSGELRHVLTGLGDKLTDEECDILFKEVEDKKGRINIEDFVRVVLSG